MSLLCRLFGHQLETLHGRPCWDNDLPLPMHGSRRDREAREAVARCLRCGLVLYGYDSRFGAQRIGPSEVKG